jgi:hypothetical protein
MGGLRPAVVSLFLAHRCAHRAAEACHGALCVFCRLISQSQGARVVQLHEGVGAGEVDAHHAASRHPAVLQIASLGNVHHWRNGTRHDRAEEEEVSGGLV